MVKSVHIILIYFLFVALLFPQTKEIDQKTIKLEALRKEIEKLEKELEANQRKERSSYSNYTNLNKQKFYIEKIISSLRNEEFIKSNQISEIKNQIKQIENQIEQIKSNYSKYIVYNYKYGIYSELEMLVNSGNIRQAILRAKYLRDFSNRQQNEIKLYNLKLHELANLQINLFKEIEQKRLFTAEKNKELALLTNKINSEQKLLNELRKDKSTISKQLGDKRRSEIAIKSMIEKLVIESQKQFVQKNLDKTIVKDEIVEEHHFDTEYLAGAKSFFDLKGRLAFPVSRGRIISNFGTRQNVRLNTVSVNYGIDILCNDPTVKSVSDGIVSAIEWLPGYGTVVIISHRGNFRTVYGHLENIQVSENQRVSAGTVIGNVSNGLEGRVLHFQIWNGRNSEDPTKWLKN